MNIFDKRPLSLILCIWLGGFVFFSTESELARIATLLSAAVLLTIYTVSAIRKHPKRIMLASAIALMLSVIASYVTFGLFYNPTARFEEGSEISATVVDISKGQYSASLILKTDSVNERSYKGRRVLLRLSNTEARDISVGDFITVKGTFADFESTESFDTKSYYFSDSICAEISDIENYTVSEGDSIPLSQQFKNMREYIRRHAIMMSNESAGNLTSALLFGERDSLSPQTRLDFTRIGISHLLALSGLHLAVLCLGITKLLSLIGIGKRTRYVVSILFVIIYMAFTGFSSSVVRAGLMLIISYTLFLFAKAHDSITSLVSAVFIICIISPFSIYDTSLWLSAFATLGIIIFAEAFPSDKSDESMLRAVGNYLMYALLSSVFAITATLFISGFTFNTISLLSPLSTLIFSLLTEVIMYLGSIMLIVGKFIPIGKLLIPIAEFTTNLASRLAQPRWVQVSVDYDFIKILIIIFTIAFFLFVILDIKQKRKYISAIVILFIFTNVAALIKNEMTYAESDIIYSSQNRSDTILIKSNSEICLVNYAQFSKSSATKAINLLRDEHINTLNGYIVTGYTRSLPDDICALLASINTRKVFVPNPRSDEEADILEMIFAQVSKFKTELVIFNIEDAVECGDYSIYRDYASLYGDPSHCALRIYSDTHTYTFLSSGMTEATTDYPVNDNIKSSDVVIFGKYGAPLSEEGFIDKFYTRNKTIILNTDNLLFNGNTYLEYKENGCEIFSHPSKISILIEN